MAAPYELARVTQNLSEIIWGEIAVSSNCENKMCVQNVMVGLMDFMS